MTAEERRKFERLKKPFIISYRPSESLSSYCDVTQIKDISRGGMRFATSKALAAQAILCIELRAPFMEERIKLKASVLESKEVARGIIYDTRVRFVDLGKDEQEALTKVINFFLKSSAGKEKNED